MVDEFEVREEVSGEEEDGRPKGKIGEDVGKWNCAAEIGEDGRDGEYGYVGEEAARGDMTDGTDP